MTGSVLPSSRRRVYMPAIMASRREDPETARFGHILRDLRTRLGLTLNDVGLKTGIPRSTLSKIENDKMSLSYDKIVKISSALNVDISELFGGKHVPSPQEVRKPVFGRRVISRAGEGVMIDTDVYASLYVASDLLHKKVVPIVVDVKVKRIEDFGDFIRHGGEEFAYVLEGAIDFYTEFYTPSRLNVGDSIYFDSNIGHAYIAACDGPCRILSICSADSAEIMKTGDNPASQHDHIRVDKT